MNKLKVKKINNKRDIPSWFSLSNYESLSELTEPEIIEQFELRKFIYNNVEKLTWLLQSCSISERESYGAFNYLDYKLLKSYEYLIAGEVKWCILKEDELPTQLTCIDTDEDEDEEQNSLKSIVSGRTAVAFEKKSAILNYAKRIREYENIVTLPDGELMVVNQNSFFLPHDESTENLLLSVNLREYTDKEILNEMSKLLAAWRKEKSLQAPNKKYIKSSLTKKIVKRQYIPLADLKIWAALERIELTQALYVDTLFTNSDKVVGETNFKQTLLPNFEKMMNSEYTF